MTLRIIPSGQGGAGSTLNGYYLQSNGQEDRLENS
jgi:hypothetical protein